MTRRTRSQALAIWHQIANGLLHDPGKKEPGGLSDWDIPSHEYYEAIDFLTQVASEILRADESSPVQRSRSMLKALQLDGKHNVDEPALRRTLEILSDFGESDKKARVETRARLARQLISNTKLPDGRVRSAESRSDIELNRQLRELNSRVNQDEM